ncbi:WecB/TagA/CpsF family glycosyltransferase [Alkalimonas sp. NCh-2]|uniref:WecB/TagA/CpsF family glycosyltransferase n=1 Tax=Alkalimonas sp. NCh-2 TaxID=3144846 RepID=UPI0031F654A9
MKPVAVLRLQVDPHTMSSALAACQQLLLRPHPGYVCLANVHMCMEAWDQPDFAALVNQAALVLADGRPVYWAQRLLLPASSPPTEQIRGVDFVQAICAMAAQQQIPLGLYGGSDDALLARLEQQLCDQYPGLQVVYRYAPPFRVLTEQERLAVHQAISDAGVQLLLVGLGCPKQERWMADAAALPVLMCGVGAAFDFLAGARAEAPRWMQTTGLEWLHRWWHEPVRLSWRYLKHNPRFMLLFFWQWIRGKLQ